MDQETQRETTSKPEGTASGASGATNAPKAPKALADAYDLVLWYMPVLARFDRATRFTIGEKLADTLLDVHAALTDAAYGWQRGESLARAARGVDRARLLSRLAHDLKALDHRRYLHVSERLVELGRMIGGWRKYDVSRRGRGADDA